MKVALLSKAIYPVRGGVELHVHNLAKGLAALGHQTHAFTLAPAGEGQRPDDYELSAGMNARGLLAALRRERFDAVHAHGARFPLAAWALFFGKKRGSRTVFTPHCFYPAADWCGLLKRSLYDPTLGDLAMRHADHVICLTENDRRDALRHGAVPQQVSTIPNAICIPEVPGESAVREFRSRHRLGRFLLCVGRLDRVKGGDFLISALTRLPEDLQLVFIGPDGGCLRSWQKQAEQLRVAGQVQFLGEVGDDDLRLAYRGCAVLVMASAYEGLPTVLLEAMALSAPVVAAEAGGVGCLIQHEVNGLLYRHGDCDDFCANVQRCLAGVSVNMLARARAMVNRQYSWETNAVRVAALYDR